MPHYLKHAELVEYRQRIARVQISQGKAQEERMSLERWINGKLSQYECHGMRASINAESGEVEVHPWPGRYDVNVIPALASVAAAQDFDGQ